jgi:hypothetical protein
MKWTVALLAALLCGVASAAPMTAATLQRLLQEAPRRDVRFTETRESQWLAAPVQSSGVMKASATVLEKRVEQPRRETWRILHDRMQLVSADSAAPREFVFKDVPALAALAGALRKAMAGDLVSLDKDFELTVAGDERLWTVQLKPRHDDVGRYLKELELQGTQSRLQVLVVLESQGDRTTTHLLHDE